MPELNVLQIEDQDDDALLIANELRRGGWEPHCTRVDTVPDLRLALAMGKYDLIISDYGLPRFDAPSALSVVKECSSDDVPFIIVSGTIPDTAVSNAMKAGAHDFVSKNDLKRLVPAVRRELNEAKSRHARKLAEVRFSTLARSLEGLVVTLDRDLVIDGAYGRGLPGVQILPDALPGTNVCNFFDVSEQKQVEAACRRVLAGETHGDVVLELTRASSGSIANLQLTISPMTGDDGTAGSLVGYLRDVTEQKRLQGQVVASDRMATIGTLAAGVAHEINNPLSALLSNLHLLGRDLQRLLAGYSLTPNLLGELIEIADDANEAANMVLTIAGDLRTFSRHAEEEARPVSVKNVLESSLRMARERIERRAHIVRDYADVPPVLAAESSLGQVFLNLLINAAQAIPEGKPSIHQVRVRVHADPESRFVLVTIADTGSGMSRLIKERLFTPFFTTKPSGVGTGLGLSISRRIVTGFGGDIEVESEEGKGSSFTVKLPVARGATK